MVQTHDPPELPHMRRERQAEFGYTPEEAAFCDTFDAFAARWEGAQLEMVKEPCRRCDVCDELRPPWMTTLRLVREGEPLEEGMEGGCQAWQACVKKLQTARRVDQLDGSEYCGSYLCDRCRAPCDKEKNMVGMHKFSKDNRTHLKRMPAWFHIGQLDAELAKEPFAAFGIAWEAELALVRLTIPWCEPRSVWHVGSRAPCHPSLGVGNRVAPRHGSRAPCHPFAPIPVFINTIWQLSLMLLPLAV